MYNYLNVTQLKKACEENNFILVRFASGNLMGINTKVAEIAIRRKYYTPESKTNFISFIPCDFHTYISYKHAFIKSK